MFTSIEEMQNFLIFTEKTQVYDICKLERGVVAVYKYDKNHKLIYENYFQIKHFTERVALENIYSMIKDGSL